jgi:hypothetical protein
MTHPLYTPSTARSPKVISFEPLQRGADAAERTRHSGPHSKITGNACSVGSSKSRTRTITHCVIPLGSWSD